MSLSLPSLISPRLRAGSRRPRRGGFSLLELTLVVAIMGVLIAVVVVNVTGQGEKAKKRATEVSLNTIKNALRSYQLEFSAYPPTLQALVTSKQLEDGKMKDGWDREFYYNPQGRPGNTDQPFLLSSNGPDGQLGTPDDISVWNAQ